LAQGNAPNTSLQSAQENPYSGQTYSQMNNQIPQSVTFNISGVTPSAATALMNQAITQLRLGARLNL
jgi:hypothetical protein